MGDRDDEFAAFVSARSRALLRTAYLLTGDHHLAEDLLQTVLAKVYLSWDRIADHGAIEGYARTALVRQNVSWWRRAWRAERPTEELPEIPSPTSWRPTRYQDPASTTAERDELMRHLRTLPPRQRAVLVLRYFDDLPEAEVATAMGCSVGTVKSQSHRALARLRAAMTPEDRPQSPVQEVQR